MTNEHYSNKDLAKLFAVFVPSVVIFGYLFATFGNSVQNLILIIYGLILLIVFADYIRYSVESQELQNKLQKKVDSQKKLIRYKRMKNGLYVTISVLVTIAIAIFLIDFAPWLDAVSDTQQEKQPKQYSIHTKNLVIVYLFIAQLASMIAFQFLFYETSTSFFKRKEYQYHIAGLSFKIASEEKDDESQMRYVILGLNSYNNYLQRAFTLQINEVDKICDAMARQGIEERTKLIKSIVNSLNLSKLEALRHLFSNLSRGLEIKQLLVKQGYQEKVRERSDVIIPIVTIAITILTTITGLMFPD